VEGSSNLEGGKMEETIIGMIVGFVQGYPWFATALMVMGVFRSIFKPLMTLIEKYVEATPGNADNEWLMKMKASKIYAGLVWFIDYSMSIKLPK
jgi:hypothetical protein